MSLLHLSKHLYKHGNVLISKWLWTFICLQLFMLMFVCWQWHYELSMKVIMFAHVWFRYFILFCKKNIFTWMFINIHIHSMTGSSLGRQSTFRVLYCILLSLPIYLIRCLHWINHKSCNNLSRSLFPIRRDHPLPPPPLYSISLFVLWYNANINL